jgi:2-amino-4-hydroxy-6-hydroxymethyldihydropteridine diphosphokinase
MPIVFIGLGSNLGNKQQNINNAISILNNTPGINVDKISSFAETAPCAAPGPKYLNGVMKIATSLSPRDLLVTLQDIEYKLGRLRPFKNAPRTIDLDILLYDTEIIDEPGLTIPHPRMFEREFVMKPLLEIEPDIIKKIKMG